MSMQYGGIDQVLSDDLKELTDHSNKFITSQNNTNEYHNHFQNQNNHHNIDNNIHAFDPFEEGASTADLSYHIDQVRYENNFDDDDEEEEEEEEEEEIAAVESSTDQGYQELMPGTSHTCSFANQIDVTERIRSMHFALMYLMSNPHELALDGVVDDDIDQSQEQANRKEMMTKRNIVKDIFPEYEEFTLPSIIFADDAEVVLPQAHTASQLFGVEKRDGIELEAAVGINSICELFRRWLAIMPNGDHFHVIDPPGVIVMRITGGRYRATATHRVVWKWMNDFLPEDTPDTFPDETSSIHFGDLVTMTIVDVFESDETGKLLSYCPTFDNRSVKKTYHTTEQIRRQSSKMKGRLHEVSKSKAVAGANKGLRIGYSHAIKIAGKMKTELGEKLNISMTSEDGKNESTSPSHSPTKASWLKARQEKKKESERDDAEAFERALSAAGAASIADTSDMFGVVVDPKHDVAPSPQTTSSKRSTTSGSFTTVYEC